MSSSCEQSRNHLEWNSLRLFDEEEHKTNAENVQRREHVKCAVVAPLHQYWGDEHNQRVEHIVNEHCKRDRSFLFCHAEDLRWVNPRNHAPSQLETASVEKDHAHSEVGRPPFKHCSF